MPVRFLTLLFLLLLGAPAQGAPVPAQDRNKIVAVVNDEVITQSELHRALVPVYLQMQATLDPEELSKKMDEVRGQVLEQLIDERLMLQEARSPKPIEVGKGRIGTPPVIEVDDQEVEALLKDTRTKFPDPKEFEQALEQQGLTVDDLRLRFKDQITIQKLIGREIRSRLSVSPSEVTAYYESHKSDFVTPDTVEVATIVIRPKDNSDAGRAFSRAQEIHKQVTQGADFYETARKVSEGFNASMGGRIGRIQKGKSRKEVDDALFKLKAGEISPVIKTPGGFHIFKIESKESSRQASLSEVQNDIQDRLLQEKGSARYNNWISKLRSNSYISVK